MPSGLHRSGLNHSGTHCMKAREAGTVLKLSRFVPAHCLEGGPPWKPSVSCLAFCGRKEGNINQWWANKSHRILLDSCWWNPGISFLHHGWIDLFLDKSEDVGRIHVCVFLWVFLCVPHLGESQEWEHHIRHEMYKEEAHSGHQTAGAYSFWKEDSRRGLFAIHCEVNFCL